MSSQEITIQNPSIELKRDKNGKTYFLICNQSAGLAYFAFPYRTKGWYDLEIKWAIAKEDLNSFQRKKKGRCLKDSKNLSWISSLPCYQRRGHYISMHEKHVSILNFLSSYVFIK